MDVELLKKEDIDAYSEFIVKVFDYDLDAKVMEECINNNKVLIIKKDEKIIASLTYEERKDYIKNKRFYFISYFGVVKEYRREGLGTKLFDYLKEEIEKNNIDYIELTSGNHRKAAHYFYRKRNFKIKDTTVFIKMY